MLIGLVGAPNKGKSTLFSAITSVDVQIADYAFTTIKPNLGVGYATKECAEVALKVKCMPRNSLCKSGTRELPINITDVAGLVPGAHLGKGMGNQFLTDLIYADALIQVVDLSGKTDINGAASEGSDPAVEVEMIRDEMAEWLADIIEKHMTKLERRPDGEVALQELLSGFKTDIEQIRRAGERSHLPLVSISWTRSKTKSFALALLAENKPMVIAANKADKVTDQSRISELRKRLPGTEVIECSAAIELALAKAASKGVIDYVPGSTDFKILKEISREQKDALAYMQQYIKRNGGTGVQKLINAVAFEKLGNMVVYPVEDESHYSDHSGNVLPDAILMKKGSTAYDLAARIHTDIAKGMKYALDAKTKMRIPKEHVLNDGDVIKIVSQKQA